MNIKNELDRAELVRILTESGLWETPEEVEDALEYRYNYDVIQRDGKTIDDAIAEFYLDDLGYIERVPVNWRPYIDYEKYGRDIRFSDAYGRAVDELEDASGRYGTDWRFYVIRWNR